MMAITVRLQSMSWIDTLDYRLIKHKGKDS